MNEISVKELRPVQLSIEPHSHLLLVAQGDNVVKFAREDINGLKKLRSGELTDIGGRVLKSYTTKLAPRSCCRVSENGFISVSCTDGEESNVVIIANHKKLDDLQRISDFVDKNKAKIAWAKEFRGRW